LADLHKIDGTYIVFDINSFIKYIIVSINCFKIVRSSVFKMISGGQKFKPNAEQLFLSLIG